MTQLFGVTDVLPKTKIGKDLMLSLLITVILDKKVL